jgi:hypothetical protein
MVRAIEKTRFITESRRSCFTWRCSATKAPAMTISQIATLALSPLPLQRSSQLSSSRRMFHVHILLRRCSTEISRLTRPLDFLRSAGVSFTANISCHILVTKDNTTFYSHVFYIIFNYGSKYGVYNGDLFTSIAANKRYLLIQSRVSGLEYLKTLSWI